MHRISLLLTQAMAVTATAAAVNPFAKAATTSSKAASATSKAAAWTSSGRNGIYGASFGTSHDCPDANNTVYTTSSNSQYWLLCGADTTDQSLPGVKTTYPGSFDACMSQCDSQSGCASVYFNNGCTLKGTPTKYIYKTNQVNRVAVKIPTLQWTNES